MPLLGAVEVTRRRYDGADTIVAHRYVAPTPTDTTITASIQPAPQDVLERLPDGEDSRGAVVLVTYSDLRTASQADGVRADEIVTSGAAYKLVDVQRSPPLVGYDEHWVATGVRL